jgi:hypothetical protein
VTARRRAGGLAKLIMCVYARMCSDPDARKESRDALGIGTRSESRSREIGGAMYASQMVVRLRWEGDCLVWIECEDRSTGCVCWE